MTLDVDAVDGGVGMSSSCAVVDERMVRVVVKVWHYAYYCMDSLRYGGIVLTTKLIIWVRERTLLLLVKK